MNAKFSFWYIEVSAYYVYNLVYLCCSLLKQQIELFLKRQGKGYFHSASGPIETFGDPRGQASLPVQEKCLPTVLSVVTLFSFPIWLSGKVSKGVRHCIKEESATLLLLSFVKDFYQLYIFLLLKVSFRVRILQYSFCFSIIRALWFFLDTFRQRFI